MAAKKTILVVEDDLPLRMLYRTALHLAGFGVKEAADGLDALRALDWEPPDLVVLDLVLPGGVSGLAVQQEIAAGALTRDIPVVIVTGTDLPLAGNRARCILRKPVTSDRLVEAVRECLTAGPPSARAR